MPHRIDKVDSPLYRVQETDRDQQRRQREGEEGARKRERDKFDKGKPFWKKLIPDSQSKNPAKIGTLWGGKEGLRTGPEAAPKNERELEGEEMSLSFSQRILVLWGILDLEGKPKVRVIALYAVVVSLILLSAVLILGILWR